MQNPYDLVAPQWHANKRSPEYVKRVLTYVDKLLQGLPSGARVLDLGCGTGEPITRHIADRGFRVTAVDESREMLKIARRVVPEAELIHADMIDFEVSGKFAAAVAWDSIFHVARKHQAAVYRKLSNALQPGARVLSSVGGSDSNESSSEVSAAEGFTSEMFGQTFFYSGYAPEVARGLIVAAGFEVELWEVDDPSSRGHIAVIARKLH